MSFIMRTAAVAVRLTAALQKLTRLFSRERGARESFYEGDQKTLRHV
ncbi:MAG: hypothetical protein HY078_10145 [Elusimicrobia bacterium]|nr:hypothetical protein [Elusimicrobiota bacterium]